MLRTAQRGTHRAEGPAVIDYSSLLTPVSKGAVGAAALTAVAATAATGLGIAPADAAPSTHNGPVSQAGTKLPSVSALGTKPLRTGHRGQQVQALQSLLNHHGASIKIDGSFGRKTRNAVITFQASSGIGVDGVVGARTRSALASKNPTSVNATPKLRPGSRGNAVKNLQSLLNKAGANIKVDGVFGRGTNTAVRNFQASAGVGVDGIVGPRTWNKLNSGAGSAAAKNSTSVNHTPKLRRGNRGDAVKNLQNLLNKAGANIKADGIFGRGTYNAVRNFQASAGVGVDGIVGPRTWNKLNSGAGSAAAKNSTSVNHTPKLRRGNRGDAVKNLQNLLNKAGANIKADGIFGRGTYNAVRNFQASAGVGVDGIVGPRTWNKLNSGNVTIADSRPTESATSAPVNNTPKLRRGNRGDAVKNLQNLLNKAGANIKTDGIFGRGTYNAVRNFQASAGVGVDGIVGPRTWNKLNSGNVTIATAPASSTAAPAPKTSVKGDASDTAIVESAKKYLGTPYVWGGSTPSGFDCSGLTSTVYRENGISIPRTARKQAFAGKIISENEARPGDLVVFTQGNYGHVGIYAGNGEVIDAGRSPRKVVQRKIWTSKVIYVTYR
ncbi:peptidoglycan-binding protein [Dermabacter sp. Marseille-Q3180]|uniref:C40 family peptidase n=1 Tax=Dermabacter sp. Marseille-Q3180 TaxID=2758090 RepID=UPI00202431D9|nr:peptidoglycan-binding protein [Dermabacter sp. Marseille-Q3180]